MFRKNLGIVCLGFFTLCISIILTFICSIIVEVVLIDLDIIHVSSLIQALNDYIHIINYLLNPFSTNLQISHYSLSSYGYTHFAEVKNIIFVVEIITIILGIICYLLLKPIIKNNKFWELKSGLYGLMWVGMPVGFVIASQFYKMFVSLHKILFDNNYWIFDPVKDSVIELMPITFFEVCAILVLAIYELLIFIMYRKINKKLRY